jgi:hypothetical protein
VEYANGTPAVGAEVLLEGLPLTGCTPQGQPSQPCSAFADGDGRFRFVDQALTSFTLTATDPVNTLLKGVAGGSVNPGQTLDVRVVLSPTAPLSGRVRRASGDPAAGVVAEVVSTKGVPRKRSS